MACSGSLTPSFVNNNHVTAEIIYSTAHAHHKVYVTAEITYSTAPVCHEVLPCSRATLCCRDMWVPHKKWWHYCCLMAVSLGSATRGENIVCLLLLLLCQPGKRLRCVRLCYSCCYGCCIGQERKTCLQFLKLFESPSSLLALLCLSWV